MIKEYPNKDVLDAISADRHHLDHVLRMPAGQFQWHIQRIAQLYCLMKIEADHSPLKRDLGRCLTYRSTVTSLYARRCLCRALNSSTWTAEEGEENGK
jgi:hypothetical protein